MVGEEALEIIGYADGEPIYAKPVTAKELAYRDKTLVYFIQGVHGGPIKIGLAQDPEQRLKSLQAGCPYLLRITHTIEGGRRRERQLHLRFAECRLGGEWFEATPELVKLAYARADETAPTLFRPAEREQANSEMYGREAENAHRRWADKRKERRAHHQRQLSEGRIAK